MMCNTIRATSRQSAPSDPHRRANQETASTNQDRAVAIARRAPETPNRPRRRRPRGLGRLENRTVAARRAPGLGSVLVIVFAKQECRQILEPLRTPPLRCHAICRCEAQQ